MQNSPTNKLWIRSCASGVLLSLFGCATPVQRPAELPCPPRPEPPAFLLLAPPEANFQQQLQDFFSTLPPTPTVPQPTHKPATGG